MSGVNLPHDHGQNIEKVLERMPDSEECVLVAEVFKQISDGSRIRILWLLCHCEECVSNIAAAMQMSDPAVSHHLKLLKKSGLIVSRRDGKEIYYRLADTQTAQLLHHIIEEMFRILVMVNKACGVEDDMVMDMIFINMRTDHIFIFSFQYFVSKLLP